MPRVPELDESSLATAQLVFARYARSRRTSQYGGKHVSLAGMPLRRFVALTTQAALADELQASRVFITALSLIAPTECTIAAAAADLELGATEWEQAYEPSALRGWREAGI